MKFRTSIVAALSAAALCLPVAAPAVAAGPVTTTASVASTLGTSSGSGTIGGAAKSKLGKPSFRELQSTNKRQSVSVKVSQPRGQKLALQRKDSGKWRTISTTRAPRTGTSATVRLKVPAKAGYRAYRVVLGKSKYNKQTISKSFRFFQSDSKKYAKYIAKARKYIKRYCPSTPIYIDSPRVKDSSYIGMAWTRWQWRSSWNGSGFTYKWRWTQTIELASGLTSSQLRHTAIHECAHIVQARPIGKSQKSYDASVARTNKVFRKGLHPAQEQQADCMATAITKSTRNNYYTRSCKGERLKNAKAMWKAWGKKYQDPERTWTTRSA
ncbi:hypothetical protein ACTVCO_01490 [Sanguibacter sp. A247]|uniref:hypothetical protein n=1 Tax=unclassified Sanguibacter TaxID=2645534 RepID=UPI003FD81673